MKNTAKLIILLAILTSSSVAYSGDFFKFLKNTTGIMATGLITAFVYDTIKASAINESSKSITTTHPFFATNKKNVQVPMKTGTYKIVKITNKSVSIIGNNNQILLVKVRK